MRVYFLEWLFDTTGHSYGFTVVSLVNDAKKIDRGLMGINFTSSGLVLRIMFVNIVVF